MIRMLREACLDALAVVSPVECAGCGVADRTLCDLCRAELLPSAYRQVLFDGTAAISAFRYEGSAQSAILAFKERGRTDVAGPLSRALRSVIESAADIMGVPVELCPVPSARKSLHRRGYSPIALLVHRSGLRAANVLAMSPDTAQQKLLGRAEREANLHGSFRPRRDLTGRRFLIVDDVVTTGSTIVEATRAIRSGGGEVVAAATIAFTPLRVPHDAHLPAQMVKVRPVHNIRA